jgi:hypothetical protein
LTPLTTGRLKIAFGNFLLRAFNYSAPIVMESVLWPYAYPGRGVLRLDVPEVEALLPWFEQQGLVEWAAMMQTFLYRRQYAIENYGRATC